MESISGFWEGVYRYPNDMAAPVRFDADLVEAEGSVSGVTTEPNTFHHVSRSMHILSARIDGLREGSALTFMKTYDHGISDHVIAYEGVINEEATLISGTWSIGAFTGAFQLERERPAALKLDAQANAVTEPRRR